MDDERVSPDGTWLCEHEPPHPVIPTLLSEANALPTPPHYVVCPDCGTHWVIWNCEGVKLAKAVIIPYIVEEELYENRHALV